MAGYRYPFYTNMPNAEYWEARSQQTMAEAMASASQIETYTRRIYRQTLSSLVQEYNSILEPYILDKETGEINLAKLAKEMKYNKGFNSKIARLDTMIAEVAKRVSSTEQKKLLTHLTNTYKNTVVKNIADIQENSDSLYLLNDNFVNNAIRRNWTQDGIEFSGRIWNTNRNMSEKLRSTISRGLIEGKSLPKMEREFKGIFNNTTYNVQRIIRTETFAIMNQANLDTYAELGAEEVEIKSNFRGCDKCAEWNGRIVKIEEAKVGITIPPAHPNCRCCILPVVEEPKEEKEIFYSDNNNMPSEQHIDEEIEYKTVQIGDREYKVRTKTQAETELCAQAYIALSKIEQQALEKYINAVYILNEEYSSFQGGNYICLQEGFSVRDVVHENAHAIASALNIYDMDEYKKIVERIFSDYEATNVHFHKGEIESDTYFFYKTDKLLTDYQGRVYYEQETYETMYPELFSVAYEYFVFYPDILYEKMADMYEFIMKLRGEK